MSLRKPKNNNIDNKDVGAIVPTQIPWFVSYIGIITSKDIGAYESEKYKTILPTLDPHTYCGNSVFNSSGFPISTACDISEKYSNNIWISEDYKYISVINVLSFQSVYPNYIKVKIQNKKEDLVIRPNVITLWYKVLSMKVRSDSSVSDISGELDLFHSFVEDYIDDLRNTRLVNYTRFPLPLQPKLFEKRILNQNLEINVNPLLAGFNNVVFDVLKDENITRGDGIYNNTDTDSDKSLWLGLGRGSEYFYIQGTDTLKIKTQDYDFPANNKKPIFKNNTDLNTINKCAIFIMESKIYAIPLTYITLTITKKNTGITDTHEYSDNTYGKILQILKDPLKSAGYNFLLFKQSQTNPAFSTGSYGIIDGVIQKLRTAEVEKWIPNFLQQGFIGFYSVILAKTQNEHILDIKNITNNFTIISLMSFFKGENYDEYQYNSRDNLFAWEISNEILFNAKPLAITEIRYNEREVGNDVDALTVNALLKYHTGTTYNNIAIPSTFLGNIQSIFNDKMYDVLANPQTLSVEVLDTHNLEIQRNKTQIEQLISNTVNFDNSISNYEHNRKIQNDALQLQKDQASASLGMGIFNGIVGGITGIFGGIASGLAGAATGNAGAIAGGISSAAGAGVSAISNLAQTGLNYHFKNIAFGIQKQAMDNERDQKYRDYETNKKLIALNNKTTLQPQSIDSIKNVFKVNNNTKTSFGAQSRYGWRRKDRLSETLVREYWNWKIEEGYYIGEPEKIRGSSNVVAYYNDYFLNPSNPTTKQTPYMCYTDNVYYLFKKIRELTNSGNFVFYNYAKEVEMLLKIGFSYWTQGIKWSKISELKYTINTSTLEQLK